MTTSLIVKERVPKEKSNFESRLTYLCADRYSWPLVLLSSPKLKPPQLRDHGYFWTYYYWASRSVRVIPICSIIAMTITPRETLHIAHLLLVLLQLHLRMIALVPGSVIQIIGHLSQQIFLSWTSWGSSRSNDLAPLQWQEKSSTMDCSVSSSHSLCASFLASVGDTREIIQQTTRCDTTWW